MNLELFGFKISIEVIIIICVIYLILIVNTLYACCNKEGFTGANTNYGESSIFNVNKDSPIDTSSWDMGNLTFKKNQPIDKSVQEILDRAAQPVPLPEGQLDMFANTPFKPECCPNTYSNSTGCACMTVNQYNYLRERGGNNVPYSEY